MTRRPEIGSKLGRIITNGRLDAFDIQRALLTLEATAVEIGNRIENDVKTKWQEEEMPFSEEA